MIKSFRVTGLWGHFDFSKDDFHEDCNIFTGSNGTGKTTLLKLIWYMMSGHFKQALLEIDFRKAELVLTTGTALLEKRPASKDDRRPNDPQTPIDGEVALIQLKTPDNSTVFSLISIPIAEISVYLNSEAPTSTFSSIFFPTFRRIEGGFSLEDGQESIKIIEGFREFSKRMSHKTHRLIAFSDFDDVRGLINEISSDIRVKLEPFESSFTSFLSIFSNGNAPKYTTSDLKKHLKSLEQKREELNSPLKKLSEYIDGFFFEKSVLVTDELKLGKHPNRVKIEKLSAGEKNLLGFLVYAMTLQNGVLFIDEPELTLHTDWQRRLLPLMRELAPQTQLIIATHSPAIYGIWPDKDIWLDDVLTQSAAI
jgi:predicted ATPase